MLTLRQSSLAHKLLILNMFMFYACVASKDRALGLGTGEIDWLWGWFFPAGLIIQRKNFVLKKFSSASFAAGENQLNSCWKRYWNLS